MKWQIFTVRFVLLLDVVGFCLILLVTQFVVKRAYRARVIGFVCGGLSVSVFAAPLSIMVHAFIYFNLISFLFASNLI